MSELNQTDLKNLNNITGELLMPAECYIASAVILFLIGIFGFVLNLIVIILLCKDKQLRTPLNSILLNLVFSDFLVSILGNPWTFISAFSYSWKFGKFMCIFYGFIMSLLGFASITTLTVLSFERYMMITKPFRKRNLTHQNAIFLIIGIWIYSLALSLPPLWGWGQYVLEAANISCSVNWEEQTLNSMTFILYIFTFGLIFPLIIIIFSYTNILITMKNKNLKMGRVTKAEGKVAYMVLLMIIAFLLAWTPYAIIALITQFGHVLISPGLATIPALLAKSSICYNPVIYVGLNPQFRQSLTRKLGRDMQSEKTCATKLQTKSDGKCTQMIMEYKKQSFEAECEIIEC